jgi:hypothetical protein
MHKRPLFIHHIEFLQIAGEDFRDSCGVGNYADGAGRGRLVLVGGDLWGEVVDGAFETSRTPINKLNGPFLPNRLDREIFRFTIASKRHTNRHILSMAWVTLSHL